MVRSAETEEYKALLRTLIAARRHSGLTQQEVAARLGKPQSYVSKIERGERRMDVVEFLRLAEATNLDIAVALQSAESANLERSGLEAQREPQSKARPPTEAGRTLAMAITALRGIADLSEELAVRAGGAGGARLSRTLKWARRIAKEAREERRRLSGHTEDVQPSKKGMQRARAKRKQGARGGSTI